MEFTIRHRTVYTQTTAYTSLEHTKHFGVCKYTEQARVYRDKQNTCIHSAVRDLKIEFC